MTRRVRVFIGVVLCVFILGVFLSTKSGSQVIRFQQLDTSIIHPPTKTELGFPPKTVYNNPQKSDSHYQLVKKNNDQIIVSGQTRTFLSKKDGSSSSTVEDRRSETAPTTQRNTLPTTIGESKNKLTTEQVPTTTPTSNSSIERPVNLQYNEQPKNEIGKVSVVLKNGFVDPAETDVVEAHIETIAPKKSQFKPEQPVQPSSCSPNNQVVFIKTHKTGSTTLGHIINRYGDARNLSFVFNKRSPNNGHLLYMLITPESPKFDFLPPIGVKLGDYDKYKYDLIAVHIRYHRQAMDSFMKKGTNYITIVRDPGYQFESAFTHFQMDDAFLPQEKVMYHTMSERISHFMSQPTFYRGRLQILPWEGKKGLRWFYSKNNQMFDLGLDHTYHRNSSAVKAYIEKLDKEMALVLITEYFDESMVLLKHTLCWSLDDIIYIAKNVRPHPAQISNSLRQKIREWNSVDTQLYDYFNKTLWRKVKEMGPKFDIELAKFKQAMSNTFEKCVGNEKVQAQGHYFHWVEYGVKKDSGAFCKLLVESKRALFLKVWKKQSLPLLVSKPKASSSKVAVISEFPRKTAVVVPYKAPPVVVHHVKPLPLLPQNNQVQLLPKSKVKSIQKIKNNLENTASINFEEGNIKDMGAIQAKFFINAVPKKRKPIQVKAVAASKSRF